MSVQSARPGTRTRRKIWPSRAASKRNWVLSSDPVYAGTSPAWILTQRWDQDARPWPSPIPQAQTLWKWFRRVSLHSAGTRAAYTTSLWPSSPSSLCVTLSAMARPCCHHPALLDPFSSDNTQPQGWYWTSALCKQAGSRCKCSSNHIIAYTVIVLHCRIKRFFHIKYRSQTQSLLYPLTHFIKFTSFLLCLCTSVPSAVCTKSYWHFNIKLLWQEDIPLAK